MDNLLLQRQKQFRATGVVLFVAAAGLLVSRISAYFLGGIGNEIIEDLIFSSIMQIGFLLIVPFLIYKLTLKKTVKGVLEFSNFRKTDWKILLLCIPFGVLVLMISSGISLIWYNILVSFGYSGGSGTPLPETFNVWRLLLELFITALLPAVCEEFTNRGGFLTTLRGSFNETQTIILGGIAFGLFHQNITQVFYTFCFGMLMTALVLKTKSIFPAMIIHFVNNALSVYSDYATTYSLPLGGIFNWIDYMLVEHFAGLVLLFLVVVAAAVGLYLLIIHLAKKKKQSDGIEITAVDGEEIEQPLSDKTLYKPTTRDGAFYIGAIVMTVLTTIATFTWGLL